jgi:hypothetical protein
MTWLILWRSGIPSGFMPKTSSLLLLFTLILVPRSMIVGRRTLCRAKSLRRSSHCLIESGFWSSKDWMALESSPVICDDEFNPWRWESTMASSTPGLRTLPVWSWLWS